MTADCVPVRVLLVAQAAGVAPELQGAGYSPSIVADTAAAWDQIQDGRPCLLLLRAEHRQCEALRLVDRLRAQHRWQPARILLLAGAATDPALAAAALDCGADECLFAPFQAAELLARVGRLVRQCAAATASQTALPTRPAATAERAEQTRTHDRLAQSLALASIAGRVARLGGWTIDLPERKLTWSDENCAIHEAPPGYQPTLEEGLQLFPAEHRAQVVRLVEACALEGTPYEFEGPKFTVKGRSIWVRSIGEAVRDATGRIVRLQGAFQDISDRVALEEQLRQAQRLESLGQLTGGVAHDFNNLLTVILGNAGMLHEELQGVARLEPMAQVVVEAAQRGAQLTQRLLAFARRQALEPRVVDINRLVSGMDTIVRRTLGDHIVIDIDGADRLWPALVDPMQLDNVLLNLCLNARDAMPQGGRLGIRTANVQLDDRAAGRRRGVAAGAYVMLAVSDTGSGIAPEHLDRVFEPFFTTKERGKGTGLGLAMTYGFLKQSGGHVEIESAPGCGTTVRLYLPRAAQPAGDGPEDRPVDPGPAGAPGGHRILLVEDDELVRRYARDQLLAMGHTVLEAESGAQALAILDQGQAVDLLFTDVVMPGMSGRQLADLARAKRPALRVLYGSGYPQDAIVHDGRLDAGVQLLAKPYRREELARRVAAILAGRDGP